MASRNPWDLHPNLKPLYFEWVDLVNKARLEVITICTYRSPEEQLILFDQHKSQLKIGLHNFKLPNGTPASKAFDFVLLVHGKVCWDTNMDSNHDGFRDYQQIGEIGKSIGLEWGGDWKTLKDCDHLQLKVA